MLAPPERHPFAAAALAGPQQPALVPATTILEANPNRLAGGHSLI
ncbi:MAG TPA: hypothetical protein VIZ91_07740 [Solirubrobacterales bacterium]